MSQQQEVLEPVSDKRNRFVIVSDLEAAVTKVFRNKGSLRLRNVRIAQVHIDGIGTVRVESKPAENIMPGQEVALSCRVFLRDKSPLAFNTSKPEFFGHAEITVECDEIVSVIT